LLENYDMLEILWTLLMLVLLQAVLGFDNLLYISLESKKAPEDKQSSVRKKGILIAIGLRIVLLFVLMSILELVKFSLFGIHLGESSTTSYHGQTFEVNSLLSADFTLESVISLLGGGFIIYTAIKEIWHMISHESLEEKKDNARKTAKAVIAAIVIMNLVFSFDSILVAISLTDGLSEFAGMSKYIVRLITMSIAIITSGVLMILLADRVSEFLKKNRLYEVLGLFILMIVGVMLVAEGGHKAHLHIFENPVLPMNKTTFYFVIAVLIIVDIVQGKYQKKITQIEQSEEDKEQ